MDQRILVPFDESEPAKTALHRALEENPDAEIIVLYVVDSDESAYGSSGGAAESSYDSENKEAEKALDEAQKQADAYNITLTPATEVGQPAVMIVDYAEQNDIDHIIMGSHGRSGLSRILVGSVAEKVIRNSPVTVTIARDETPTETP